MDDPRVNWLLYKQIVGKRKKIDLPKLGNIGSFRLHIIHGVQIILVSPEATHFPIPSVLLGGLRKKSG